MVLLMQSNTSFFSAIGDTFLVFDFRLRTNVKNSPGGVVSSVTLTFFRVSLFDKDSNLDPCGGIGKDEDKNNNNDKVITCFNPSVAD